MLLKSGFSGLLTSNGIGTTEIGPPPQAHSTQSHASPQRHQHLQNLGDQSQSVIGGSVSTFRAPSSMSTTDPASLTTLGNGSPLRNNSSLSANQHQFVNLFDCTTNPSSSSPNHTPLSTFKINNFHKNGTSTLYSIASRNGSGGPDGVNVNMNQGEQHQQHSNDCGGTLIKSEVGKLKSALHKPQQMPFPASSPLPSHKALNNHVVESQLGGGHPSLSLSPLHNYPEQTQTSSYLHQSYPNNGVDIDQQQQQQFVATGMVAETEDIPSLPASMTLPIDCFAMTNHQRHDEIQLLNQIQDTLKEGWTVHLAENGRLYYCK